MRSTTRSLRHFGLYLLPAGLLTLASSLLIALLYYPAPGTETARPTAAHSAQAQTYTDAMLAALLADAVRQLQTERQNSAQTLMYRYQATPQPGMPEFQIRTAPPTGSEHSARRDHLIML